MNSTYGPTVTLMIVLWELLSVILSMPHLIAFRVDGHAMTGRPCALLIL
jgi:hypothetical protein